MSESTHQMRQVLWYFQPGSDLAVPPGENSFKEYLIKAVCKADRDNQTRLYMAFPAMVWAVTVIKDDLDGYDKVRRAIREEEGAPL